jgi:hypothetical protein
LTYFLFQIDEPPTKRYFFPAYICVLLAALAMMSRAKIPQRVIARRWEILAVLAAPVVIGPMFAEAVSTDVTPDYTAVDAWVEKNTDPNDLLIADEAWSLRFYTGRPVLESGQVAAPPIWDGEKVAEFLRRFGDRFGDVYLLPRGEGEASKAIARYRAAGLTVERVTAFTSKRQSYKRQDEYEQVVYHVHVPDGGD